MTAANEDLRQAYVELLKRSLLGLTMAPAKWYRPIERASNPVETAVAHALQRRGKGVLARPVTVDMAGNVDGTMNVAFLPPGILSMIGSTRMNNVTRCVQSVVTDGVPGDLIETGVWRGGTSIFMRGLLRAHGVADRTVYAADSFRGLPTPDPERYPADRGIETGGWPELAVSVDEVRANFARYDLLDNQVEFLEGWFRDTLPGLRGHRWSLLRLDGDLYESTMDALINLYPNLSPGGWVIVDDHSIPACAQAVADYRAEHNIDEPIETIDWTGVCWQKKRS
ncbi:MAG: TylF/MycF family methyltransferase [Actinomycetota bacterium]|nr:TylF/MycF family methyltransferase [Actinomycetota bacterium]